MGNAKKTISRFRSTTGGCGCSARPSVLHRQKHLAIKVRPLRRPVLVTEAAFRISSTTRCERITAKHVWDLGADLPNESHAAYPLVFPAFHITEKPTDFRFCGAGIILLTRDCMAIPELSGFPRRWVPGAYNRQGPESFYSGAYLGPESFYSPRDREKFPRIESPRAAAAALDSPAHQLRASALPQKQPRHDITTNQHKKNSYMFSSSSSPS